MHLHLQQYDDHVWKRYQPWVWELSYLPAHRNRNNTDLKSGQNTNSLVPPFISALPLQLPQRNFIELRSYILISQLTWAMRSASSCSAVYSCRWSGDSFTDRVGLWTLTYEDVGQEQTEYLYVCVYSQVKSGSTVLLQPAYVSGRLGLVSNMALGSRVNWRKNISSQSRLRC